MKNHVLCVLALALALATQVASAQVYGFSIQTTWSVNVPWWTESYRTTLANTEVDAVDYVTVSHGFVRLAVPWKEMELTQGNIDFSLLDKYVARADQHGLPMVFNFFSIPTWANNSTGCDFWISQNCSDPPTSAQYFYNFALAVAQRYPEVAFWELWNEPDLKVFWNGSIGSLKSLILQPGRDAIRSVLPGAQFISPPMVTSSAKLTNLLNSTNGWWAFAGIHVYNKQNPTYTALRNQVNGKWTNAKNAVTNSNKNLAFWITEVGVNSNTVGEQAQADTLAALIDGIDSGDIHAARLTIHTVRDNSDGVNENGILRTDLSHKPSYDSVRDTIYLIVLICVLNGTC